MESVHRSISLILRIGLPENRKARDQEKWAPVFRPITRQTKSLDGRLKGGHGLFGPML
jgi:hypothetical protein